MVDRETGFVVPRNDTQALLEALANLIMSPTLRRTYGRAGRLRYEQKFTFEKMASQTTALYEWVNSTASP